MSQEVLELLSVPATGGRAAANCFHCGEPCLDRAPGADGRVFCCLGCQTVFGILRENGLDEFYRLQATPGRRVRSIPARAKWHFLDDPALEERLFDFADGHQARVTLELPGIHCVACVWLLENLFKLHPGIGASRVNFARREAAITFEPDKIKFSELAALLASIGYEPRFTLAAGRERQPAEEASTEPAKASEARRQAWLQIGVAGFAFGNIMLMSLPCYFGLDSFNAGWFKIMAGWLSLALALPVVTYSASDFWRAAWLAWRQRVLTLEVPIAFGLAAIYCASIVEVAACRGPGYCDSLTGLIFVLLCGRWFQKRTHERLAFDRDYKGFFPLSAIRKTPKGEESVAISRLETGDRIVVRNGELLPADARLACGEACVDYSFVTGEAELVRPGPGARLYAGGRQAGGAIEVEIIKSVAQSYLASLWNHAAFSKTRDRDLDSLTNRYSRRFTKLAASVALGAAAFWLWRDPAKSLPAFASVLIVACPCALALAAPLTYGTVQRLLARLKIHLRNALVIERLAEVDTIVFDKTGTLTAPDSCGVRFQGARLSAIEKEWISSLARQSTHPNSARIAKWLGLARLPVAAFQETPGCGVAGEIDGNRILLGSKAWVSSGTGDMTWAMNIKDASEKNTTGLQMKRNGFKEMPLHGLPAVGPVIEGSVFVAINGAPRGAFALENTLRPEMDKLIAALGGQFELALLSGDNAQEAPRFLRLFGGAAELKFNQSPADKLRFIRGLQRRGRRVMMVGDGLNDAGALKQADVGVAVVEEAGAFSPASDVIMDASELARLGRVLEFCRGAMRVVRMSFAISAVYNVVGVSIAAAGLLQPMACAILMPISSASVVFFACSATAWTARRLDLMKGTAP